MNNTHNVTLLTHRVSLGTQLEASHTFFLLILTVLGYNYFHFINDATEAQRDEVIVQSHTARHP